MNVGQALPLLLAVSLPPSLLSAAPEKKGEHAWPTFWGGEGGSRYTAEAGPDSCQLLWRTALDGFVEGSPVVANGKVFVGTTTGTLYAIGQDDGRVRWTFGTGAPVKSACVVHDGTVFVAPYGGKSAYALDENTGKQIWKTPYAILAWMANPAVVGDKIITVSTRGGLCLGLNLGTGRELWRYEIPPRPEGTNRNSYSSPCVDASRGLAFYGSYLAVLCCVSISDGSEVWRRPLGEPFYVRRENKENPMHWGSGIASGPTVADGVVYVGALDRKLYAVDELTGTIRWSTELSGEGRTLFSSPAVTRGKAYVGTGSGQPWRNAPESGLHCIDVETHKEIWFQRLGSVESTPALTGNNRVYVCAAEKWVYCLDAGTGDVIWRYETFRADTLDPEKIAHIAYGAFVSSPVVAGGSLYISAKTTEGEGGMLLKLGGR